MKSADKSGARFSLVLGADELTSGTAQLKEMRKGEVTSVTLASLADELIKRM
jgi:histidyl-tRNA synthetase